MTQVLSASDVLARLGDGVPKMGDIKKLAKEIKRNHDLALELWATGRYYPRMLAVLIMDKKLLTQEVIDSLAADLADHEPAERNRISEWLMANQLMKDKATVALLESWEHAESPVLRRLFWYHQARLRWSGQPSPSNTQVLLDALDDRMQDEHPDVQWAMNFAAAWIGVFNPEHRNRVVTLGERLGLYADEVAPPNCTPNYLPKFVEIEVAKRKG